MKTLGQLIFTAVEAATLGGWLALVLREVPTFAIVVLLVGFFVEHFIAFNVKNARPFFQARRQPFGSLVVLAVLETIAWAAWLALIPVNVPVSAVVLFVLLLLGHIIEVNVVNGFPLFANVGERLRRTLDITAIETVVGIVWRMLVIAGQGVVAFVILFAGLFVEHFLSGRKVFQRGQS